MLFQNVANQLDHTVVDEKDMDKMWAVIGVLLLGLSAPIFGVGVYNITTTLTGDSEEILRQWVTTEKSGRIGIIPTFSNAMNMPAQALWCGKECKYSSRLQD